MADDKDSSIEHYGPLLIAAPKPHGEGESSGPTIDLEAVETVAAESGASAESASAGTAASAAQASRWRLSAYAPLAAGIATAAIVGAFAGAGTTAVLMRDTSAPPAAFAAADATRALQDSVAQLGADLATLKTGLSTAQRSTSTQFVKLTERLDRTEKSQAEPTAKLTKLQESVDRLERRQQVAAAPAADITGSIAAPKDESKPLVAEGWRLRDFYDGRAVVESRNGTLFRVGPGSNVPGLGKVETIKRENGKVVVVTASGTITAALEPQRRPNYYYRW